MVQAPSLAMEYGLFREGEQGRLWQPEGGQGQPYPWRHLLEEEAS